MRRVSIALLLALLCSLTASPALAQIAPRDRSPTAFADFPVPGGRFYSQASGQGKASGYSISDEAGAAFWRDFQRLGGVESVGYPASRRFEHGGFVHQATQRFLLQWRPELGRVVYANAFDVLSAAGRDEWLQRERGIPPPADWSGDRGLPWDQVVARHMALLDQSGPLRAAYLDSPSPIETYGLPQSYADVGPAYVLRAQRAAFQLWKVQTPFARAGQVTVVLGGDLVKESGLLPPEATAPEPASGALVAPPGAPIQVGPDLVAAARRTAAQGHASTVKIVAPTANGQSQGTGIVLDNAGHVLTNAHVVDGATSIGVVLPNGAEVAAVGVARDRLTDLAVLTVPLPPGAAQPAVIGDSQSLRGGDVVVAVGYTPYFPAPPTDRIGIFGGRDPTADLLRTETFILPGDSGGPLFDLRGRVIGVNQSISISRNPDQPIVGSSIDIGVAAPVVAELIANGRVARPFLGVQTVSLTPRLAAQLGVRGDVGALVTDTVAGAPAAAAGIRAGDVIVAIGGTPVRSTRDLASALRGRRVGETVAVALVGQGGARTLQVRLAETPA